MGSSVVEAAKNCRALIALDSGTAVRGVMRVEGWVEGQQTSRRRGGPRPPRGSNVTPLSSDSSISAAQPSSSPRRTSTDGGFCSFCSWKKPRRSTWLPAPALIAEAAPLRRLWRPSVPVGACRLAGARLHESACTPVCCCVHEEPPVLASCVPGGGADGGRHLVAARRRRLLLLLQQRPLAAPPAEWTRCTVVSSRWWLRCLAPAAARGGAGGLRHVGAVRAGTGRRPAAAASAAAGRAGSQSAAWA